MEIQSKKVIFINLALQLFCSWFDHINTSSFYCIFYQYTSILCYDITQNSHRALNRSHDIKKCFYYKSILTFYQTFNIFPNILLVPSCEKYSFHITTCIFPEFRWALEDPQIIWGKVVLHSVSQAFSLKTRMWHLNPYFNC